MSSGAIIAAELVLVFGGVLGLAVRELLARRRDSRITPPADPPERE